MPGGSLGQGPPGQRNGHPQTGARSVGDLGREHRGFWVAGTEPVLRTRGEEVSEVTEPVLRPGGEEVRAVRTGCGFRGQVVSVTAETCVFTPRVRESHCRTLNRGRQSSVGCTQMVLGVLRQTEVWVVSTGIIDSGHGARNVGGGCGLKFSGYIWGIRSRKTTSHLRVRISSAAILSLRPVSSPCSLYSDTHNGK